MKYPSILLLCLVPISATAKTWLVGPTHPNTAPSAVASLVSDGDTVLIDSGLYIGDVATWSKSNLVLRCPDGMARFDAAGNIADTKGIWVMYGNNTYVEGFEFYGAAISFNDGNNGAGIRVQGDGFTCRRCYFHSNQEGILTGNDTANDNILIESCIFDSNGVEGTENGGWQHNIYIGESSSCTIEFCYFHHAMVGHELKCRANRSYILYNYIVDGPVSDASLSIDIPQGGLAIVMGNIIEKGPMTENSTVIGYGEEGFKNPDTDFYFVYNTIVTDRNPTTLFEIATGTKIAYVSNNIFAGTTHPIVGFTDTGRNVMSTDTAFFHFADPLNYDYHFRSFPGFDRASNPINVDGFTLAPIWEYADPEDSTPRNNYYEIGAFEDKFALSVAPQVTYPEITNYPNPFSSQTTISLPNGISGSLQLSNECGNRIEAATHPDQNGLVFERGNLPAGIYFYRITAADGKEQFGGNFVIAP